MQKRKTLASNLSTLEVQVFNYKNENSKLREKLSHLETNIQQMTQQQALDQSSRSKTELVMHEVEETNVTLRKQIEELEVVIRKNDKMNKRKSEAMKRYEDMESLRA